MHHIESWGLLSSPAWSVNNAGIFTRFPHVLQVTPIIWDDGVSYMYVQYSNLYLLIVSRENVNAASMLLFLHKLRGVFVHYFNELEEESLRDNFVIAYELLDEVGPPIL